jgi:DNA-binding response OmpR family regulator
MADHKKILIVEDDADISMVEEAYLNSSGFETKIITEGTAVAEAIQEEHYDLVLLDLMLPGKSGYEVCREIRDRIDIPILMVTARTESVDKIRGLGLGADDYIAKPFDPAELVARVHANLRQYERLRQSPKKENNEEPEEIRIHDLRILVNSWKVYKGEKEIKFPNREFEILKFFAMNPNIVFSKEQIFEKIWGYDYVGDSATVMVHINRIREKIEDDSKNPRILETVWGAGYRLNKLPEYPAER